MHLLETYPKRYTYSVKNMWLFLLAFLGGQGDCNPCEKKKVGMQAEILILIQRIPWLKIPAAYIRGIPVGVVWLCHLQQCHRLREGTILAVELLKLAAGFCFESCPVGRRQHWKSVSLPRATVLWAASLIVCN